MCTGWEGMEANLFCRESEFVTAENRKQFLAPRNSTPLEKRQKRQEGRTKSIPSIQQHQSSIRQHVARHWHTKAEDSKDPFALLGLH